MKTLINAENMRKIEDIAINTYKIPSLILMENAGREAAMCVPQADFVRIFCGKGNNGADGFCIARHLHNRGTRVEIITVSELCDNVNADIVRALGVKITPFCDMDKSIVPDVLVDAIFGIGLSGEVSGIQKEAIEYINKTDAYVLAVDIPSGINADTGEVLGTAVRADKTVTFGYHKQGLHIYPGKEYANEVVLCDISIPREAQKGISLTTQLVDKITLPKRAADSNKGDFGRVLTVCGSDGMAGAAYMATTAAVRAGAGLVTAIVPDCIKTHVAKRFTEAMCIGVCDNGTSIEKCACEEILKAAKTADAVLIGCGMRNTEDTAYLVKEVVKHNKNVVVDADGLNSVKDTPRVLSGATITPHPKEMARLMHTTVEEVQKDRLSAAKSFATRYNCTVVLKGAATVIAYPDGRTFINTTGNAGMSTGGTGDVLAGLCAAFMAQKIDNAEVAAVFIHGLAGDLCQKAMGQYAMTATDIVRKIPTAIKGAEEK